MAYDQNTPRPTETPAQSQPLMAGNFLQIANSYNTDHVSLSSGSNIGQHVKVSFSQKGVQTIPAGGVSVLNMLAGTGTLLNYAVPNLVSTDGVTPLTLPMLPDIVSVSGGFGFQFGQLKISFGNFNFPSGAGTGTQTLAYTYSTVYTALANINKASQFGTTRSLYTSVAGNTLTIIMEISNIGSPTPIYYLVMGT